MRTPTKDLDSTSAKIKSVNRHNKKVTFEIANVTSFGSGYLMKDVGNLIKKVTFKLINLFPEPTSTKKDGQKLTFSNVSQYFSFSLSFDEINSIIIKNHPTEVKYINGISTITQPKFNLLK